ncbi:MAG TPA: type II CAAX endopeptidase family protein [Anaerolineales bacterium]|nr:type II CAAX endopeptidase family protein [Anaerolineales bacterium]
MSNLIKRNPLIAYFVIAFAFSWTVYFTLIAIKYGWMDVQIPMSIHYLASFGPALAALIVTALTTGKEGLKELWARIVKWRIGWGYAVFAIFSPLAFFVLATIIARFVKGEWLDVRLLGQANYLPYLGVWVLPLWLVTFGFGEEIGWRGFALPRLQKTMSVQRATLTLALVWVLWHTPAFFYLDTIESLGGLIIIPGFVIGVLFGAVLLTWLYNGSGGSILAVAVWHALFDLTTASEAGQDIVPIVTTAGVILWALYVANVEKPWGFRLQEKHVL